MSTSREYRESNMLIVFHFVMPECICLILNMYCIVLGLVTDTSLMEHKFGKILLIGGDVVKQSRFRYKSGIRFWSVWKCLARRKAE